MAGLSADRSDILSSYSTTSRFFQGRSLTTTTPSNSILSPRRNLSISTTFPPYYSFGSPQTYNYNKPVLDYFTHRPRSSTSTPSSPIDLLVATFDEINLSPHRTAAMDPSNILKLQTEVAYSPQRPIPKPVQESLSSLAASNSLSSLSSTSSSASSSSSIYESRRSSRSTNSPAPSVAAPAGPAVNTLKCTRCKRSVSIDSTSAGSEVISFGTLHYCSTCTSILERRAAA